jgi:putative acetyltransferase
MTAPAPTYDVRCAVPADAPAIREINWLAFRMESPGTFEKLLASGRGAAGRVALNASDQVIAHIIFSPATIAVPGRSIAGMGLGELAVLPRYQNRGVGTRLGEAGLAALAADSCPFCIVVGHASYYPRFGFERGSRRGLTCQWPKVPDASFMVRILDENAMRGVTGVARFTDVD